MVSVADAGAGMALVRGAVNSLMTPMRPAPPVAASGMSPPSPQMNLPSRTVPGPQMMRAAMPTDPRQFSSPAAPVPSTIDPKLQAQIRPNNVRLSSSPTPSVTTNGASVDVAVGMYGAVAPPGRATGSTSGSLTVPPAVALSHSESTVSDFTQGLSRRASSPGSSGLLASLAPTGGNFVVTNGTPQPLSPRPLPTPTALSGGASMQMLQSVPQAAEGPVVMTTGEAAVGSRRASLISNNQAEIATLAQPIPLGEAQDGFTPRASLKSDLTLPISSPARSTQTPGSGPGSTPSQNSVRRDIAEATAPVAYRLASASSVLDSEMSLSERCRARFGPGGYPGDAPPTPGAASTPKSATGSVAPTGSAAATPRAAPTPRQRQGAPPAAHSSSGVPLTPRQSWQPRGRQRANEASGASTPGDIVGENIRRSLGRPRPGGTAPSSARTGSPNYMKPRKPHPRGSYAHAGAINYSTGGATSSQSRGSDSRKKTRPRRPSPRRLALQDESAFSNTVPQGRNIRSSDPWVDRSKEGGQARWFSENLRFATTDSRSPSPRQPSRSPSQGSRCSMSQGSAPGSPRAECRPEVAQVVDRLSSRETVSSRMRRKEVTYQCRALEDFVRDTDIRSESSATAALSPRCTSASLGGQSTTDKSLAPSHDCPTHGHLSQVQADCAWLTGLRSSSRHRENGSLSRSTSKGHLKIMQMSEDRWNRVPGRHLGGNSDSYADLAIEEDVLREPEIHVLDEVLPGVSELSMLRSEQYTNGSPRPESAIEDELSESAIMGSARCGPSERVSCAEWSEEDAVPAA